jgi:GNAT superfamily N-acetyltransferase
VRAAVVGASSPLLNTAFKAETGGEVSLHPPTTIDIKRDDELTLAEWEWLGAWSRRIFGAELDLYEWAPMDWHILVQVGGEPVSEVAISERTATVGGQDVGLAGITNVMTLPEWRGQGYATAALRRAHAFACEQLGSEFSLLFCDQALAHFYRGAGWGTVDDPVVVEQRGQKVPWEGVVMVRSCGNRTWPGGPIDLCGPPW